MSDFCLLLQSTKKTKILKRQLLPQNQAGFTKISETNLVRENFKYGILAGIRVKNTEEIIDSKCENDTSNF